MYRQLLFCGKGEGFVAGCSQAEEISRKEKEGGEGGRKKGPRPLSSPVRTGEGRDKRSPEEAEKRE